MVPVASPASARASAAAASALATSARAASRAVTAAAFRDRPSRITRSATSAAASRTAPNSHRIHGPAAGATTVSLGSTVTPNLNDWAAASCDNTTATFTCLELGSNSSLGNGLYWVQSTAHPLPATPASLLADFYTQILMYGS